MVLEHIYTLGGVLVCCSTILCILTCILHDILSSDSSVQVVLMCHRIVVCSLAGSGIPELFLDCLTERKKSPQHHILQDSSLHVIFLFDIQRTVHRDIFLQ